MQISLKSFEPGIWFMRKYTRATSFWVCIVRRRRHLTSTTQSLALYISDYINSNNVRVKSSKARVYEGQWVTLILDPEGCTSRLDTDVVVFVFSSSRLDGREIVWRGNNPRRPRVILLFPFIPQSPNLYFYPSLNFRLFSLISRLPSTGLS